MIHHLSYILSIWSFLLRFSHAWLVRIWFEIRIMVRIMTIQ